jgi:DNA-binding HxlR family transcriptional regulator
MDTIDGANPKMLTARLRELERNDLIGTKVYPELPPRVEYSLSERGMALKSMLEQLAAFSMQNYSDQIFRRKYVGSDYCCNYWQVLALEYEIGR